MTTSNPTTTVDQREARILAALEFETPIQQVTYDEANYPPSDLVQTSDRERGGWTSYANHPAEQNEAIKKCYKLVIAFVVILVAVSVNLGSIVGLHDTAAPALPMTPIDTFTRNLPAYSLKMAQANASSPQAKALTWLQGDSDDELYRLNQRYALGVLYYSTKGELWNSSLGWMSNRSECGWRTSAREWNCDDFSRLLHLDLTYVTITGSLPRELEFLADLQFLRFVAIPKKSVLSGSIPSEMYVHEITGCWRLL
jgi:hypothetical protein